MNYKIGDKVVVHSKSVGWNIESSGVLRRAKMMKQQYLYIVNIEYDDREPLYVLHEHINRGGGGDYFLKKDFTRYAETKRDKIKYELLTN